jgi:hypothetical protein
LSEYLPGGLGSFGAFGNALFAGPILAALRVAAGIHVPLPGSIALSLSCGLYWTLAGGFSPTASLSLSFVPENGRTLQYRQDLLEIGQSFQLALPVETEGRLGLAFDGEDLAATADKPREARLTARYENDLVGLSGSASWQGLPASASGSGSGSGQAALALTATSSLAFAGGHVGLARELGDAFLFLVPGPTLAADSLELRQRDGLVRKGAAGEPLFITNLPPWRPLEARLDFPASPPDRKPSPESFRLEPAWASGSVLVVRVAPSLGAAGRLVGEPGKILRNRGGRVFAVVSPLQDLGGTFSDEAGRFEVFGLGPGDYVIAWNDGRTSAFSLEEEGPRLLELGDVPGIQPTGGGTR